MTNKKFLCAFFATLLVIGSIGRAVALEWEASLTLGEIYTDNVELATDDLTEDEWITLVLPAVSISHIGQRLELDIDYSLEALFYADVSDRNGAYSQLASQALVDVIGNELRLLGQWTIDQVNIDPDLPLTSSNLNVTGNRTDSVAWAVGPEWRQILFGTAEVDAFYYGGEINYDDPAATGNGTALQDVETRRGAFALRDKQNVVSALSWELAYTNNRLIYEFSPEVEIQAAWLQLGYRLASGIRLTALGGADTDYADPNDSSLSEGRWEVGLDTEFNDDLIEIAVGHRFFGTTYRFRWNRDRDDKTFRASYNEAPSNADLLTTQLQAPEEGAPLPPDGELGRPGNANRFIYKRADAGAQWRLSRSMAEVNFFWERREYVAPTEPVGDPDTLLGDEESYGTTLNFRWELGTKTIVNLGGSWRRREVLRIDATVDQLSRTDEDDLYRIFAGVDYQLGRKTSLSFNVSSTSRSGKVNSASDYDQFVAELRLARKL